MPDIRLPEVTTDDLVAYRQTYQPAAYLPFPDGYPMKFFAGYRSLSGMTFSPREVVSYIINRYNRLEPGYTIISLQGLDLADSSMDRLVFHILPYFEKMYGLVIKRYSSRGTLLQLITVNNLSSNNDTHRMALSPPVSNPTFLQIK